MEGELLKTIKNLSFESLCIAFVVFGLTMLIKWPIKKCTNKFAEEKRRAINSVILFIPIVLSLICSILYFGIFNGVWFNLNIFETAISSWILSLSIYAIFDRIKILINGIFSGKNKFNDDLTKETISFLKENIKNITSKIKVDEKQLTKIRTELAALLEIKSILKSGEKVLDIAKFSETNIQIQDLKTQEQTLQKEVAENQNRLNAYNKKLYN